MVSRKPRPRVIADGMLLSGTPVEDYREQYGLWVKREDLACLPPGPPFSKTRGVYAHVKNRPEELIGVLDTFHSQAGHAVARACQILGKKCINFYPVYKRDIDENGEHELRNPQISSEELGAELYGLPAGRSCILYHSAKRITGERRGYIMPNALKLDESVTETAKEVPGDLWPHYVIIPASSGTIAAGVIRGLWKDGRAIESNPTFIVHLGYSRAGTEVRRYLAEKSGVPLESLGKRLEIIDEGYAYKDVARDGETPPWPCNQYYDLKAFRWWLEHRRKGTVLFWNIG